MTLQTNTLGPIRIHFWRDNVYGSVETFCNIELNNKLTPVGIATLNPGDRPCKETGRKVALARAMGGKYVCRRDSNGKLYYHWDYSRSPFTKEQRAEIWRAYHGRKNGNGIRQVQA